MIRISRRGKVKNVLLVAPDVARVFILRDEPCPKAGGNETAERLMPPVASVPLSKASQQSWAEKTDAGRHVCNCNSEKRSLYADARRRVLGADVAMHSVNVRFWG